MIRKNPSGHLPVIDESAYIDKTAIICKQGDHQGERVCRPLCRDPRRRSGRER